jgi:hypothetical protein
MRARPASSVPGLAITVLTFPEYDLMGHSCHLVESARDTDDGSQQIDSPALLRANVCERTHHFKKESFEVATGKLVSPWEKKGLILPSGQSASGPPRLSRTRWNPSDEEGVGFRSGIRPRVEVEITFEMILGLIRQKIVWHLPKNPSQTAMLAHEIASWVVLRLIDKVVSAPVATFVLVGGLFGYRAHSPPYCDLEVSAREKPLRA